MLRLPCGWLPVHFCALGGSSAALQWLSSLVPDCLTSTIAVADGANASSFVGVAGRTPLHLTALCGHVDATAWLLSALAASASALVRAAVKQFWFAMSLICLDVVAHYPSVVLSLFLFVSVLCFLYYQRPRPCG